MIALSPEQIDHLRQMEERGRLTPEAVLEDARRKASPLHTLYDWDVKRAAHEHWLEQTRRLIRQVQVQIVTQTTKVTAVRYIPDPTQPARSSTYMDIDQMSEREQRLALVQECNRALGHMRRVERLAAAFGLDTGIAAIISDWADWRDDVAPVIPLATAAD